jgi:hypothetical protein
LNLLYVLLGAVVFELLSNLVVPMAPPVVDGAATEGLAYLSLLSVFVFHLTSTLALGVAAYMLWEITTRLDLFHLAARRTISLGGGAFLLFAAWSIFLPAPTSLAFYLETSAACLVLLLALALLVRPGDVLVKLGLLVVAIPFLLHYYATFALRLFVPHEAALSHSLPDTMRTIGQYSLGVAAVLSPLCFSPRPLRPNVLRPGPLAIAVLVGIIATIVLRKFYEVGMELASRGLGIDLGVAAPAIIVLYVLGAAAVAWTLTATMGAPSPARRTIGVGLALVVCGGYAFAWPLEHLAAACGLLAIARGGALVRAEEAEDIAGEFTSPAILPEAWQTYLMALQAALETVAVETQVRGDLEETRLSARRHQVDVQISLVRVRRSLHSIDVTVGAPLTNAEVGAKTLPNLTLTAKPEGLRSLGAHPEPPAGLQSTITTADEAFDRRFRAQGERRLLMALFDEPVRTRAAAVLDGWLAIWTGRGLRYRVYPGRGAPLDHPIPVTELAFRGASDTTHADRLVSVVDLICLVGSRLPSRAPEA